MNRIVAIITAGVLTLLCTLPAAAQKRDYKGDITLTKANAVQQGSNLIVTMRVEMNDLTVRSQQSVDLTPVIESTNETLQLPKISVKGRNNLKAYARRSKLGHPTEHDNNIYAVERGYRNVDGAIDYNAIVPFEGWMKEASLVVKFDNCGCGRLSSRGEQLLCAVDYEKLIEPYKINPQVAFVQPATEAIKNREVKCEALLEFQVNRTVILPSFANNRQQLDDIEAMIKQVDSDKDITVMSVDITGYASPEGTLAHNQELSKGRAKALQNYMTSRTKIPAKLYTITFGGEDWDGLVKEIEAGEMKYKQEVLDIINKYPIEGGREKRLMDLRGGVPYKFMLKEYFPSLRRVVMTIDYSVRDFNVEEAKEVIKTNPKNLSLNEMYHVANTYAQGSEQFCNVFDTAVRMFPNDPTANLNAAAAALSRGDATMAEKYLGNIKGDNSAAFLNDMGVAAMLKGDWESAESYLTKAAAQGSKQAAANLEEIKTKRQNMAQIEEQRKRFNL